MFERVLNILLVTACLCPLKIYYCHQLTKNDRKKIVKEISIKIIKSIKAIINQKKPTFHAKCKFCIILIYQSPPRFIFKKQQQVFHRKSQKLCTIKVQIFSLTFLLFVQTTQLSENRHCHATFQILFYKRSSCQKKQSLKRVAIKSSYETI